MVGVAGFETCDPCVLNVIPHLLAGPNWSSIEALGRPVAKYDAPLCATSPPQRSHNGMIMAALDFSITQRSPEACRGPIRPLPAEYSRRGRYAAERSSDFRRSVAHGSADFRQLLISHARRHARHGNRCKRLAAIVVDSSRDAPKADARFLIIDGVTLTTNQLQFL